MKHDAVARIRFEARAASRPLTSFLAQAKLPRDEPGHPFGQWSLAVELWRPTEDRALAWIAFVSPDAPRAELRKRASFELYAGPRLLGRAEILEVLAAQAPPSRVAVDRDFLANPHEPVRDAA